MAIDLRPHPDFAQYGRMLRLTRFALLLGLFVLELPVIKEAANGRDSGRGNLDKIQIAFARDFKGLLDAHSAQSDALVIDYKDLAGPDTVVDS
jgi:hypothetical protein